MEEVTDSRASTRSDRSGSVSSRSHEPVHVTVSGTNSEKVTLTQFCYLISFCVQFNRRSSVKVGNLGRGFNILDGNVKSALFDNISAHYEEGASRSLNTIRANSQLHSNTDA